MKVLSVFAIFRACALPPGEPPCHSIGEAILKKLFRPELPGYGNDTWFTIQANAVSPGYFQTLGIPVLQGRDFADQDINNPAGRVVINETMARRFWPGTTPIGKLIRFKRADPKENRDQGPELCEVIGIVKDVRYKTPWEEKTPYIYFPYWHWFYMQMTLHVSTSRNPYSLIAPVQRMYGSADSADFFARRCEFDRDAIGIAVFRRALCCLRAGDIRIACSSPGRNRSVWNHLLFCHSTDSGVRHPHRFRRPGGNIVRQVLLEGLKMAAFGLAIGLAGSVALSRFLASRLHGLSPLDPATYAAISVLILVIAFLAAFLPARRAPAIPWTHFEPNRELTGIDQAILVDIMDQPFGINESLPAPF